MVDLPFRWNITNRSYLGTLVNGEKATTYDSFSLQLLDCSDVLALANDSDLIFVGRSPESIFDHLSGLLYDTSWCSRLELLQFSMRFQNETEIRARYPRALFALREYLRSLRLSPTALIRRERPVTFIDLVLSGDTFSRLITMLRNWAIESRVGWSAVSRKLRLVGITERKKTSPNTWRWQQHAECTGMLRRGSIKNVSIPQDLWVYLGDYQLKVTRSFTPARWAHPESRLPARDIEQLKALRLAHYLFNCGLQKERREEFVALLTKESAMKFRWFRALVHEIRS